MTWTRCNTCGTIQKKFDGDHDEAICFICGDKLVGTKGSLNKLLLEEEGNEKKPTGEV